MKSPVVLEGIQFWSIDDYLAVCNWMRESGDTHAQANEIYFSTPEMTINSAHYGRMTARPGDWIMKKDNKFFVLKSLTALEQ